MGGEPEGSDESIDTAIPATSAAAIAASRGLSAEKDSLISISTGLTEDSEQRSVAASSRERERERGILLA